jgi:hypothetical protein
MFAAVVGHCFCRATPSLRNAPPRQSMEIVRGETIYRSRNAVQTNPATSVVWHGRSVMVRAAQSVNRDDHAEDATYDGRAAARAGS